jgi:hypothetical protein
LRAQAFELAFQGLKLSHALDAVLSPGPAQKFQNQDSVLQERFERECAWAIGGVQ